MSVFEELQHIIADQLEIAEDEITPDTNIVDDLGADSLDIVDIVMSVEDTFGIEVPDEALEDVTTVNDMVKYIEDHK